MRLFLPGLLVVSLLGCSSSESSGHQSDEKASFDTGWQGEPSDGSEAGPPSEVEDDFLALRPAQTTFYVFITNPARDTVTRVNIQTLAVDTTPVGRDPRIVQVTPDYHYAVVFNRGDDSVSIIDADSLEQVVVPVREHFNAMSMSPDDAGTWVALYHDVDAERPDDPEADGLQSYNEVSFVNTVTHEHYPMAVDFNPRDVVFTADGTRALVVTDRTVGLVDLTASQPLPELISVAKNPLEAPRAEEVVISPAGDYALVRQFGTPELAVIDLLAKSVEYIPVSAQPTDLDLSADGTFAALITRGSEDLYLFDMADPFRPPEVLDLPEGQALGSLLFDPLGEQAIVYTTASLVDRYATWDLSTDVITLRPLVKPVKQMAVSPTGTSLLAFHTREDAPDADPTSPFRDAWALTMIDLADFRDNPLRLPAEPTGYANAADGRRGYFIMEGEPFLEILDYQTLLHEEVVLKSDPVYVGVLPDLDTTDTDQPPAWVSQEHALGRITFFDADDSSLETITGFELNSLIED